MQNKLENEDPRHARAILDSFKFKSQEKIRAEEPQETIAERVKLQKKKQKKPHKNNNKRKRIKNLNIKLSINQATNIISTN